MEEHTENEQEANMDDFNVAEVVQEATEVYKEAKEMGLTNLLKSLIPKSSKKKAKASKGKEKQNKEELTISEDELEVIIETALKQKDLAVADLKAELKEIKKALKKERKKKAKNTDTKGDITLNIKKAGQVNSKVGTVENKGTKFNL